LKDRILDEQIPVDAVREQVGRSPLQELVLGANPLRRAKIVPE
jgi:hypothetical protein